MWQQIFNWTICTTETTRPPGNAHAFPGGRVWYNTRYKGDAVARHDRIHPHVRQALVRAGWRILKEELILRYGTWSGRLDLLAHASITATHDDRVIVVEVKGFQPQLKLADLEKAIGHYLIYKSWMRRRHPAWELYLAISTRTAPFFAEEAVQVVLQDCQRLSPEGDSLPSSLATSDRASEPVDSGPRCRSNV